MGAGKFTQLPAILQQQFMQREKFYEQIIPGRAGVFSFHIMQER